MTYVPGDAVIATTPRNWRKFDFLGRAERDFTDSKEARLKFGGDSVGPKTFTKSICAFFILTCSALAQTAVPPQDLQTIRENIVLLHEEWNHHGSMEVPRYPDRRQENPRFVVLDECWIANTLIEADFQLAGFSKAIGIRVVTSPSLHGPSHSWLAASNLADHKSAAPDHRSRGN